MKITTNGNYIRIQWEQDHPKWSEIYQLVEQLPDRSFHDPKRGSYWKLPFTAHHAYRVIEVLDIFHPRITDDIRLKALDVPVVRERVAVMDERLYEFQKTGVEWMDMRPRKMLADSVGLGKTIQALIHLKNSSTGRILIIVPKIVLWKWERELLTWTDFTAQVVDMGKVVINKDVDAIITTFDLAKRLQAQLLRLGFVDMVVDESQKYKNPQAGRTKTGLALSTAPTIKTLTLLTATPIMNRRHDLWAQLNMLQPGAWGSWHDFGKRFCDGYRGDFGWEYKGASNTDELVERMAPVYLRRTKREVIDHMPDVTIATIPIQGSYHFVPKKDEIPIVQMTRELKEITTEKMKVAITFIKEFIEDGEPGAKIAAFAFHVPVIIQMHGELEKAGIKVDAIIGKVSASKREEIRNRFMNEDTQVLLFNLAGAEGIDMHAALDLVMITNMYTPGLDEQIIGRVDRMKAKDKDGRPLPPVTIHRLHYRNSLDDDIILMLDEKDRDRSLLVAKEKQYERTIATITAERYGAGE